MSETKWQERLLSCTTGETATLRRCAGKTLREADASALRIFYSFLPYGTPSWQHDRYFTIMCCVSLWKPDERKNPMLFVDCLRESAPLDRIDGLYSRVRNLLDAQWDDDGFMAVKLARLMKIVKNSDRSIYPDFDRLLQDLIHWNDASRSVQRLWAEKLFSLRTETDK